MWPFSLGTDQVLHVLDVYPPWGQPMHDPGLNLLAIAYRCIYTVPGGYITAKFAPYASPVASNRAEEGRAKNRRVELVEKAPAAR